MDQIQRYHHLDALRGLAILLIVGIHARGYADPKGAGLSPWVDVLWSAIEPMAVPAFFLVDGYLFARTMDRPGPFDYLTYLRRSALRLLVPWLVFSVLYTSLRAAFEAVGFLPDRLVVGRSAAEVARNLYESQIAPQMYFLLSLFLIRSISFATRWLARAPGWIAVLTLILFSKLLIAARFQLLVDPITDALSGFRYYLIGIIAWRYDRPLRAYGHWIWPVLVLAVVGLKLADLNLGPTTQYLTLLAAYVLFLALTRRENVLVALGRQTMGLYLLHVPVVMKVAALVSARLIHGRLGLFLTIWALSFLGALVLNWAVLRIPRGRMIFGEFQGGPTRADELTSPAGVGDPLASGAQRSSR